jgi:hypothetical protein
MSEILEASRIAESVEGHRLRLLRGVLYLLFSCSRNAVTLRLTKADEFPGCLRIVG